jgi:hypothetical protein
MKMKISTVVFFILTTFICKAQAGNLQFNQVLTYNGTLTSTSNPALSPIYTCPAGKVWKIESKTRTPLTQYLGSGGSTTLSFYLNGVWTRDLYPTGSYTGNYAQMIDTSPLWLKAGDNIYFEFCCAGSATYTMSIIEYNIVP